MYGRSPQSSDEGIVLDNRWEGPRSSGSGRVEDQRSLVVASSLIESRQSLLSDGEGQVLSQRNAADHSVLAAASLIEGHQSQHNLLSGGEGQVLSQQKAAEHRVVVKCGGPGYELTSADLRTLEPHMWLNDQVSLNKFLVKELLSMNMYLLTFRGDWLLICPG